MNFDKEHKICRCIGGLDNTKHALWCPAWECELPTNDKFELFTGMLCCWNGTASYEYEYAELQAQIKELLTINGGLAQGCRSDTDEGYRASLELAEHEKIRAKELGISICKALNINFP